MNNLIEWKFAAVTDRRYKSGRKLRKDSILGRLPAGQRAMVDKWLFDKGMTYQEVAEACGKMFEVKVGKSSVGRYFQAKSNIPSPKSKVGNGAERGVSEKVGETETPGTAEEIYEQLLAKARKMAWLEANLPAELRDVRFFCQLMRILIAARRERNQAVLAAVERKKFEVWAARKVLRHLRYTICDLRAKGIQSGSPQSSAAIGVKYSAETDSRPAVSCLWEKKSQPRSHPPSSDFGAAGKRGHRVQKWDMRSPVDKRLLLRQFRTPDAPPFAFARRSLYMAGTFSAWEKH